MGAGRGAWCAPGGGLTQGAHPGGSPRGPGRERRARDGGAGFISLRAGVMESQEGEIWEAIRERNWGKNAR